MYKTIFHYLKQDELSCSELSYLIGCHTAKALQHYLYQMSSHGFIKRVGKRYQLATPQPLMVHCSRCNKEILTWTADIKKRCPLCQPEQTLSIVSKAAPQTTQHDRITRLLQQPFSSQYITNAFSKEPQQ